MPRGKWEKASGRSVYFYTVKVGKKQSTVVASIYKKLGAWEFTVRGKYAGVNRTLAGAKRHVMDMLRD